MNRIEWHNFSDEKSTNTTDAYIFVELENGRANIVKNTESSRNGMYLNEFLDMEFPILVKWSYFNFDKNDIVIRNKDSKLDDGFYISFTAFDCTEVVYVINNEIIFIDSKHNELYMESENQGYAYGIKDSLIKIVRFENIHSSLYDKDYKGFYSYYKQRIADSKNKDYSSDVKITYPSDNVEPKSGDLVVLLYSQHNVPINAKAKVVNLNYRDDECMLQLEDGNVIGWFHFSSLRVVASMNWNSCKT